MSQERQFTAISSYDTQPTTENETVRFADGALATPEDFFGPMPDHASSDPEQLPEYAEMPLIRLYSAFKDTPDADHGMSEVLGDIVIEQRARPANAPELTYEKDIIAFARSEAVRLHEEALLKDVDLSIGDEKFGKIRMVKEELERAAATESDPNIKTEDEQYAAAFGSFLARHANTETAEQRQKYAVDCYEIGSRIDAKPSAKRTQSEKNELRAARQRLKHRTYELTNTGYENIASGILLNRSAFDEPVDPEPSIEAVTTQAIQDKREQIAALEEELSVIYAKRENKTKKWFGLPGLREVDQEAVDEYTAASNELFKLENHDMLHDSSVPMSEKIKQIALHTIARGRKLEDMMDAQREQGRSKFRRAVHWLGRKAVERPYVAAVATGLSALGLGIFTGGIAGGAVTGAMAYARQNYKQYADRSQQDRIIHDDDATLQALIGELTMIDNDNREYADDNEEIYRHQESIDDLLDHANGDTELKFAERANQEQKKRLLGRVAVGAVAAGGAVVTYGLGQFIDAPQWNPFTDTVNGTPVPEAQGDLPVTGDAAPGQTPGADLPGPQPDTAPAPAPVPEFAPNTFYAHPGDGFYNILQNMGVDASLRDDVLARASSELYSHGYAYQMSDGWPGIPSPGNLPQGAIDILVKAAGR